MHKSRLKPNQRLFVELIIVIDNGVYKEKKENLYEVHKYSEQLAEEVNSVSFLNFWKLRIK